MSCPTKVCPFCGSIRLCLQEIEEDALGDSGVVVVCEECLAQGPPASRGYMENHNAISKWDERVEEGCLK